MALISPRVVVTLEDGTEQTVQTDNRDAVQWDIIRARKSWPSGKEAPMLWLTTLAWHALKRTGQTDLALEKFIEGCLQVVSADKEPIEVDPTQSAADTDS